MPAFSFTAPHVTLDEERIERENLTEEKRREIHNDLYGLEQPPEEGQQPLEVSREMMERFDKAMALLPDRQKMEYIEAMECVPKLVETESNPKLFLRCEKFDCEAAAARLAHYWKIRKKLFDHEKAHLPMSLSGAMTDERELFGTGFLAVHPTDQQGRVVFFIDRIRAVPPLASRKASLRCIFFMIHILVRDDPAIHTHGCVCLVNIKGYDLYKHFDRLMSKHLSILLLQCMPLKVKGLHLLAGSANGVMSLVLPSMKQVMGRECRLRMVVHSGTDVRMLDTLAPYGITARNVSDALSGDFTHEDFVAWLEQWQRNEKQESVSSTQPGDLSDLE